MRGGEKRTRYVVSYCKDIGMLSLKKSDRRFLAALSTCSVRIRKG